MQEHALDVTLPRIEEHFDRIRANLIRCEECNENFFFDFLRHPSCKNTRKSSDMPHAFEPNELGRRQALLHLRQFHEAAYNAFMRSMPAVDISTSHYGVSGPIGPNPGLTDQSWDLNSHLTMRAAGRLAASTAEMGTSRALHKNSEAERSRIRRMRATPEAKRAEAERSKRRREQLTPALRQADAERRARKKQSEEERIRNRQRRSEASPEARAREVRRSRERRQNATEQQRQREAQRSRARRKNASEEQRLRERERCRRRYEAKKQQKLLAQQGNASSESEAQLNMSVMTLSETATPPSANPSDFATVPRPRVLPGDLERRSQQLRQQQAGLGLQLQSLYASLALPSQQMQL
ncbi:hypothetical protein BBJ29_007197 [Phytophthora kernoviae]|uniref:Uncharacterized protein n=1 Tax=Phytophthora kernoviae TaxID=325452 RepID=A0A3F2RGT3_9STRA|nr:hypothetical protein BBJ29_007197 [Phytophthora kernoviae]RLN56489.1 hypothetical protein BBP00_00007966 [Phytophthora kernoviae]